MRGAAAVCIGLAAGAGAGEGWDAAGGGGAGGGGAGATPRARAHHRHVELRLQLVVKHREHDHVDAEDAVGQEWDCPACWVPKGPARGGDGAATGLGSRQPLVTHLRRFSAFHVLHARHPHPPSMWGGSEP